MTASLDSTALLWSPSVADGPVAQLVGPHAHPVARASCPPPPHPKAAAAPHQTGHDNAVCGVHVMPSGDALLTTSWDR